MRSDGDSPFMRVVRPAERDGRTALELMELPRPQPQPGEVLIEVNCAGVNYSDVVGQRTGVNRFTGALVLPGEVPGGEVAGVRADTGERVLALCQSGGYAEWALAPAELTYAIPDGITDEVALALFVSGLTAWFLYRPFAHLKGGESVLVPAATGAVGSLLVQLGRLFGAGRVIGAASTQKKRDLALTLGADAVVDSATAGLAERVVAANGGHQVDVAFEMAGGSAFKESLAALAAFGRVVVFGTSSGDGGALNTKALIVGSKTIAGMWLVDCLRAGWAPAALEGLFAYARTGELSVSSAAVYGLAEADLAQRDLVARKTTGKVLLHARA